MNTQLIIYGCEDKYSHYPVKQLYQKIGLSPARKAEIIAHYRNMLSLKAITLLHIVDMEVNSETGTLEIVTNEVCKIEPLKRIIINPAAAPKKIPMPEGVFE